MRRTTAVLILAALVFSMIFSALVMGGCGLFAKTKIGSATADTGRDVVPSPMGTSTYTINVTPPAPPPAPDWRTSDPVSLTPSLPPPAAPVVVKAGDRTISAPPGSGVSVTVTEPIVATRRTETTSAKTASLRTSSEYDASKLNLSPPSAMLPSEGSEEAAGSTAGGVSWKLKGLVAGVGGPWFLWALGGLLIVAGLVVAIYFKQIALGAALALAGGALLAVLIYPWLLLVIGGVAVIGVAALFWHMWKAKTTATALDNVVAGVEAAPAEASAAVKASIGAAAAGNAVKTKVKAAITKVKAKLGL